MQGRSAAKSKSEYAKEWRARMERENPEYMDLQRAKARERSLARHLSNKDNPEYMARERARKRELQSRRRADPVKAQAIREYAKRSRVKPENRAKQAERMKAWRDANKEAVMEYQKEWRNANTESIREYSKAYSKEYLAREDVQAAKRDKHRKRYYRMTPEAFNSLWDKQDGKCGICGVEMEPRGRKDDAVSVDHHHVSGEVRGLLCKACNRGIGCLKDNPEFLKNAAEYLLRNGFYGK